MKNKPIFIAGPCVIETDDIMYAVAEELVRLNKKYDIDIIFKSSFDKANRTSINSFRGPGIEKGIATLSDIKTKYNLRVTTDVHEAYQVPIVAESVDIIQIPAFLCRQTDLLVAAAKTGKTVNIKKAQFLSAEDMRFPMQKVVESGSTTDKVWLTERGNMYGYNNLVVDFRNITYMKQFSQQVIMDCTHSTQRPGSCNGITGGDRQFIHSIALAAKAFGATGYFFEVHPDLSIAKCDATNMLHIDKLDEIISTLL